MRAKMWTIAFGSADQAVLQVVARVDRQLPWADGDDSRVQNGELQHGRGLRLPSGQQVRLRRLKSYEKLLGRI